MSVSSLLKDPEISALLESVTPPLPQPIREKLLVPPQVKCDQLPLIGTAFDYMLRFELQRRLPHARTESWAAEKAVRIARCDFADSLGPQAEKIVAGAKADLARYVEASQLTEDHRTKMAAHSIRLAKLDGLYRAGKADKTMELAEDGNVQEVLRLLSIVPFPQLTHPQTIYLNPSFGKYSTKVGGADCDLIVGENLVDLKVTTKPMFAPLYLHQLISYFILARASRRDDPSFPNVDTLGLYFARHGVLWTLNASEITKNDRFLKAEDDYLRLACQRGPHPVKKRSGRPESIAARYLGDGFPWETLSENKDDVRSASSSHPIKHEKAPGRLGDGEAKQTFLLRLAGEVEDRHGAARLRYLMLGITLIWFLWRDATPFPFSRSWLFFGGLAFAMIVTRRLLTTLEIQMFECMRAIARIVFGPKPIAVFGLAFGLEVIMAAAIGIVIRRHWPTSHSGAATAVMRVPSAFPHR